MGETDSPAFVTQVETALERELSRSIMRGNAQPERRKLSKGEALVRAEGTREALFLLLYCVIAVEVDGSGSPRSGLARILGERALLESGVRTSTLVAVTPYRLSVASVDRMYHKILEISRSHRRES